MDGHHIDYQIKNYKAMTNKQFYEAPCVDLVEISSPTGSIIMASGEKATPVNGAWDDED